MVKPLGAVAREKADGPAGSSRLTIFLCFLVALIEGFELQAAGVAAPGLAPALGLTPTQLSGFFSASTIGMLIGAYVGGSLSDRHGRKHVLLLSVAAFGIFSLLTGLAPSYFWLVVARFLTGVGLGGALPNIIALSAENNAEGSARAVALTYSGTPLGGALAGLVFAFSTQWEWIFFIGALLPLAIVPALLLYLPDHRRSESGRGLAPDIGVRAALFGHGRLGSTLALWLGFFLALLVLYLMLNWTPMLLAMRGFERPYIALFQVVLNVAGAICCMFAARWLDGPRRFVIAGAAFGIVAIFLALVAVIPGEISYIIPIAVGFGAGMIISQSVLYAIAPQIYPAEHRGAGVGAAISVGRTGSVVGPVVGGVMLSSGISPVNLLIWLIPIILISGSSAMFVMLRKPNT